MLASYEVTSGWAAAVSIVVLGLLFLAWLVTLFLVMVDSISLPAKILWFVAITCLAPVAIPIYLILRHLRRRAET